MKIEYCQKCDKGIKAEDKAYIKDGQILCEECYLTTTKQPPRKREPQLRNGKLRDTRNLSGKIDEFVQKELDDENASELLKVDLPKRITSGLNQKEKGKRERSVMKSSKEKPWWDKPINVNALAGGIFLVVIVTIWAYYLFDKPAKTGIEKPQRGRDPSRGYRVERVRRTPKRTPEHNLAIIHEGWKVPGDHTTVFRFRYLLQQLDAQCIQSKEEIADMTVTAQQVIREEGGIKMNLLSMMEEMNKTMRVYRPEGGGDYAELLAAEMIFWMEGL